jgi:cytochrome b561
MTSIGNTEDHFGAVAILLHWSMALLIIGLAVQRVLFRICLDR